MNQSLSDRILFGMWPAPLVIVIFLISFIWSIS